MVQYNQLVRILAVKVFSLIISLILSSAPGLIGDIPARIALIALPLCSYEETIRVLF